MCDSNINFINDTIKFDKTMTKTLVIRTPKLNSNHNIGDMDGIYDAKTKLVALETYYVD